MDYVEHLTVENDRWDLLAWTYYGDACLYEPILVANPEVPIRPFLEAGIRLRVPVLQNSAPSDQGLPPWKRARA